MLNFKPPVFANSIAVFRLLSVSSTPGKYRFCTPNDHKVSHWPQARQSRLCELEFTAMLNIQGYFLIWAAQFRIPAIWQLLQRDSVHALLRHRQSYAYTHQPQHNSWCWVKESADRLEQSLIAKTMDWSMNSLC